MPLLAAYRPLGRCIPPSRLAPCHLPLGEGGSCFALRLAEEVALAVFVLSFSTMGANLADLYSASPQEGDVWIYHRHKTGEEARVQLVTEIRQQAARLGAGTSAEWWLPALHRYATADIATKNVNRQLAQWAEREGLPPFTFYAARKSWGTLGRKLGIEKATIDEGLAHVGDFPLTDIYAERNWQLAWDANRRVLDLFRW